MRTRTRSPKIINEEFEESVNEVNSLLTITSKTPEQVARLAHLKTTIVPQLQQEYNDVRQNMLSTATSRGEWRQGDVVVIGEEKFTTDNHGDYIRV